MYSIRVCFLSAKTYTDNDKTAEDCCMKRTANHVSGKPLQCVDVGIPRGRSRYRGHVVKLF